GCRGSVEERNIRNGGVHQIGLGPRGAYSLSIVSLLQVLLSYRGSITALAQSLELLHDALALFALASPQQRDPQVVSGRDVVGLGSQCFLQNRGCLLILALLQV